MIENLHNEIWLPVTGYEGLYEVSNQGRIKSLVRWRNVGINNVEGYLEKEKIITPHTDILGYKKVCLRKQYKGTTLRFHRVVTTAFLPNPENKRTVNHKNGDKGDNRLDNLEWATDSENIRHSFEHLGRKGWTKGLSPELVPASKPVLCENFGVVYPSATAAGEAWGYDKSRISEYCKGKFKNKFGLSFRYI